VYSGRSLLTFRRNELPPFSGSKSKAEGASKQEPKWLSACLLARFILQPWRWRHYVPPKRRQTYITEDPQISYRDAYHVAFNRVSSTRQLLASEGIQVTSPQTSINTLPLDNWHDTTIPKVSPYDTLQTSKSRPCHSCLPTCVAQVRCQVTYCGICGGQSDTEGTEEGYYGSISVSPANSHSTCCSTFINHLLWSRYWQRR
jgi:hypothetical protein